MTRARDHRVADHAALDLARGQVAVVLVLTVRERLASQRQAQLLGRRRHLRAGQRDVDNLGIDSFHGPADGGCQVPVLGRHVVERTMRLEVGDFQPGIGRHPLQRADLIGDHVFELVRPHVDAPAPEAP